MTEQIDEETYMELYGVSPKVILILMGAITWVLPFGVYYINLGSAEEPFGVMGIIGFLFSIDFSNWLPYLSYMNPFMFWQLFTLGFFNLFFLYRMYKYYDGRTTKLNTITVGIFSVVLPLILAMVFPGYILGYYVGPIPIQFICGLIIMHRIPGPEIRSPWAGHFTDYSWYHWRSLHKSLPGAYRGSDEEQPWADEDI